MLPRHAVAFLLGILATERSGALEGLWLAAPFLACAVVLCTIRGPAIIAVWAAGMLWALARASALLAQQLAPELEGRDWLIQGEVVSIPALRAGQARLDFAPDPQPGLPRKLRLTWSDTATPPAAAERWQLRVRLRAPRGFANPGAFDYEGGLYREGIGATGYVRTSQENLKLADASWVPPVLAVRAAVASRINASLRGRAAAGIIAGLAVGATEGISPAQWQVFAATGTTHLIAISGLHVTMVAACVIALVRVLWRLPRWLQPRTCQSDVACLSGAVAALCYALLAGFSVPTQRTLVMLLIGLGSQWLRRAQPASQVLSGALVGVLIIDPLSALTAGFWLSFLAVAALLAMLGGAPARPHPIRQLFAAQNVVSVALLPATLLLFGSISLIAPLANLVAIPAFSVVLVPLTLLGTACVGLAPVLSHALFVLAGRSADLLWPVLEWAGGLPSAIVYLPRPSIALAVLLAGAALIALCPLPLRVRVTVCLVVPLLLAGAPRLAPGDFGLTVLDVGQGLAVVVRTSSHALLFDTGPRFRSGSSAGELAVVPYLHRVGIRALDLVVISHADADHAGGMPAVERALGVREMRSGAGVSPLRTPAAACERGEAWVWDEVRFQFLSPGQGEHWSENDGSCVLEVSNRRGRALVTGDIQVPAELRLAQLGLWRATEVIVVPHHGSRSSSSAQLVRSVKARYAVVSAAAHNRWHFPHDEVVERWCSAGTQLISTAEWGAVTFEFRARAGLQIPTSYRAENRHYWSARAAFAGRSQCR